MRLRIVPESSGSKAEKRQRGDGRAPHHADEPVNVLHCRPLGCEGRAAGEGYTIASIRLESISLTAHATEGFTLPGL
jgi:hypothetical protein